MNNEALVQAAATVAAAFVARAKGSYQGNALPLMMGDLYRMMKIIAVSDGNIRENEKGELEYRIQHRKEWLPYITEPESQNVLQTGKTVGI